MTINKQIHPRLAPDDGEASVDNFKLVESTVPELKDGQVLVKHHFMSLDPYMRGRMNDAKSYAAPQPLNAVMQGGTVGEIVASKNADYAVGQKVVGFGGWQDFSVVDASHPGTLRKVDTAHIPLSAYLGAVGMPGVQLRGTASTQICKPAEGKTIVVSAASGAVGSVVGQLAKARGCRVVGIAMGGADKCGYVTNEGSRFDACVDYKAHKDPKALNEAVKAATPDGVDGYFENVGGAVFDAVLARMNAFSRIALCGMDQQLRRRTDPVAQPAVAAARIGSRWRASSSAST